MTTTTTTTATAHVNACLTARVTRTYDSTETRCERCGCEPRGAHASLFYSEPQDAAVCSRCYDLAQRNFRTTALTSNQFAVLRAIGLGARTTGAIVKVSGVGSARDSVERLFDVGLVRLSASGFVLQHRVVAAAARRVG